MGQEKPCDLAPSHSVAFVAHAAHTPRRHGMMGRSDSNVTQEVTPSQLQLSSCSSVSNANCRRTSLGPSSVCPMKATLLSISSSAEPALELRVLDDAGKSSWMYSVTRPDCRIVGPMCDASRSTLQSYKQYSSKPL